MAFKQAADVDFHVLSAFERAAHVQAGGVGQAHALRHQGIGHAALGFALQRGQLGGAVDARHLGGICRFEGRNGFARRHGVAHHVGQIELLLGVVAGQQRQQAAQQGRGRGHDAAVALAHGQLGGRGVFLLHDGLHAFAAADDAAIARGVFKVNGEQRQPPAAARLGQRAQRGGLNERHIARENEGDAAVIQQGQGLLRGMPRAQLRLLQGGEALHGARPLVCLRAGLRVPFGAKGLHFLRAMPRDHHAAASAQLRGCVQHMPQHGPPGQALEHFGQAAFHARALARSQNDDVKRCRHLQNVSKGAKKSRQAHGFGGFGCGDGRRGGIRTRDPLHPMQVRYQAALHAEQAAKYSLK